MEGRMRPRRACRRGAGGVRGTKRKYYCRFGEISVISEGWCKTFQFPLSGCFLGTRQLYYQHVSDDTHARCADTSEAHDSRVLARRGEKDGTRTGTGRTLV
eukprot:3925756-Prymnesium_polylepis.1